MADDATFIFFRRGRGTLRTGAATLAKCGMTVRWLGRDEFAVGYPKGPQLRVAFVKDSYVREEAEEIGEGTPHAAELSRCDVRYEILIDDLDGVLDEINTLIEIQATLQNATGGFMFNTWNGELAGPESDPD